MVEVDLCTSTGVSRRFQVGIVFCITTQDLGVTFHRLGVQTATTQMNRTKLARLGVRPENNLTCMGSSMVSGPGQTGHWSVVIQG